MKINLKSQISNLKSGFSRGQGGFTLIELVVVIAVLVTIGSIAIGTITFSLRGTNKTNTIENIRQNGNYAISQIAKTIEYAQSFDGLSSDGTTYTTSCPITQPTPTPSTSNYSHIRIKSSDSNPIVYHCTGNTITQNGTSFIDTDTIVVSDCSFTCTVSGTSDVPVIGITFTLSPVGASELVEKSNPPIKFETSVTVRNYQR